MIKALLISTLLMLYPLAVHAAGTMTLSGTIQAFSPETLEIFDGHKVYKVSRSKIRERGQVSDVKAGKFVTVNIPFEAVLEVTDKAK